MATSRPARRLRGLLAACLISGLCWEVAAAQTVPRLNSTPRSGVLQPPRQVDPKMTRAAPRMSARSMPVIHPKTTGKDGTVLVPR